MVDKKEDGSWECPVCTWRGDESKLVGDYCGDLEVVGGSVHCETVCPECGTWLSNKEYIV